LQGVKWPEWKADSILASSAGLKELEIYLHSPISLHHTITGVAKQRLASHMRLFDI
jgi:hypothetical protein